jgi:ribosomal protein S18 acetylase RimI-like enzyme
MRTGKAMTYRRRQGPVRIRQLTAGVRSEIEALAAMCRRHEPGLDLPLYLGQASPAPGETNHLGYYCRDVLVGYAHLDPGDDIEVQGMVHPDHRRKGIGRALLEAARDECRLRGASGLTLVAEEAAPSGQAFARAVGGVYRFSEHRMELDRTAFAQRRPARSTLVYDQAGLHDLDALVAVGPASRDATPDETRQAILRWLGRDNQRFFIGRLRGEPVAMLRVNQAAPGVFVQSFRVHPAHRGRGYGRQVLTAVLERLVAEGWDHILIEVATDNEVALSLYDSCGFRQVATYLYYWLPA